MKLKKSIRLISMVLAVLTLLSVVSVVSVYADPGESYSGTLGDCSWTFTPSTGKLVIGKNRGQGGTNFDPSGSGYEYPWVDGEFTDEIKSIVMEEGILEIPWNAFYGFDNLTSVSIPSTVTLINSGAFEGCRKLTSVTLPSKIQYISDYAFESTGLKSIKFPKSVKRIGDCAFRRCKSLKSVTIPEDIKAVEIGEQAFLDTKLSSVFVSKGVASVGEKAFGYIMVKDEKDFYNDVLVNGYVIKTAKNSAAAQYAKDNKIKVSYYALNKTDFKLGAGRTFTLKTNFGTVTKWTSSNKNAVKISSKGVVTSLKKGTTTIKAALKDGTNLVTRVTVPQNPSLSKSSIVVRKNKTKSIKIYGKASAINNKFYNTKVAKFVSDKSSSTLKIKGLKTGKTTIRVLVNGVIILPLKVTVL